MNARCPTWESIASALMLFAACASAAAESLWTTPQSAVLPLAGEIQSDTGGRGFVVDSDAGGIFAVTESTVFALDALHTLVSSNGTWLTLRGINTGIEVRRSFGSGLLPVEPCPSLLPGADAQLGNLQCSNGAVRRMDGLAVVEVYSVRVGYRLRDLWSDSIVLLEREVDHALVVGVLQENPPAIEPTTALGISTADLSGRLQLMPVGNQAYAVYESGNGYRILRNASTTAPIVAAGELLPRQQCIAGGTSADRLVAVERVAGTLQLRTYGTSTPTGLIRQDALEVGDRLVCALTTPDGLSSGPYVFRAHPGGDQLLHASAAGLNLIYTAVDPVRGLGQLLSVGQILFVRYTDGSVYRMASASAPEVQTALTAPAFTSPIEAGMLATDPVREYALGSAAESGMAQLEIAARDPANGQVLSTTNLPLGVNLTQSGLTTVSQVLRHPDWPAQRRLVAVGRKASSSAPAGVVYYSIQGPLAPTPLLDQQGAQPTLGNLVLSGPRVHALKSASNPPMLMRFGNDGSYQGQTQVQATQLIGQVDGSVLAVRATASGSVVAQLSGDIVNWERSFGTGCRLLDFDAYPLMSCEQGIPLLATLSRLDPQTGAAVWQRLVTPLDLQLSFEARIAWTQGAELRVLSWGTRGGSRALCVARIDPATGTLLGVSNTLSTTATSFGALGVHGFPYTHRWIFLLTLDSPRLQRIAIRVDSNGSISVNLLGQSLVTEPVYLSENVDRLATNEGPRWYVSGRTQGYPVTSAQAYPQTTLTLPLSLTHTVEAWPGREDRAGVRVRIVNPNLHDALAARLHLSLLNCPEINHLTATIDINVPANSERQLHCTANFTPDSPLETTAYLRQPLNGVLTRDFVTLPMSIGTLGRDGFEDDAAQ